MVRSALVLLLVFGLSGCGGCGDDAPLFTITDPGTGPENADSLAPLAIGYRYGDNVIDGMVEGPYGAMYRAGALDSAFGRYYLVTEDGVFNAGDTDVGMIDRPNLIVPVTVRKGMKWTGTSSIDGTQLVFEVTERFEETPTRWRIESRKASEAAYTLYSDYVEGIGPHDERSAVRYVTRDAEDSPPVRRRSLTLEALPNNSVGTSLHPSMVRFGTGPAVITAADTESSGMCVLFDGNAALAEPPPSASGVFVKTQGPACVSTNICNSTANGGTACQPALTGNASGALVEGDGTISWVPRTSDGGLVVDAAPTGGYIGASQVQHARITAFAVRRGANGNHEVLAGNGNRLLADADVFTGTFENVARYFDAPWSAMGLIHKVIPFHHDGSVSFLIQANNMLWTSHLPVGGVPTNPKPAGMLSGRLSVLASEHGTEVLRVTVDGAVDAVTVDETGLVVTHLADIALPPGQGVVGAWRWREADGGSRLVVQTVRIDNELVIGRVVTDFHRSREDLPTSGDVVPVHPALEVMSGALSRAPGEDVDVWACWRGGSGASDPASWSLAVTDSETITHIDEDAACATLMSISPFPLTASAFLRGMVPGVGRIQALITSGISYDRAPPGDAGSARWMAALSGGGVVTNKHRYAVNGVYVGLVDEPFEPSAVGTAYADMKGNGLWYVKDGELRLLGRTTQHMPSPNGQPPTIQFATAGGGVVVTAGSSWYHVTPTGTWTAAPTPQAGRTPCARTLDGSLCGTYGDQWYCQPPSGPEVTSGPLPTGFGTVCAAPIALPDGRVIAHLGDTVFSANAYLLAADGSATQLANGFPPTIVRYAADGTPFTLAGGTPPAVGWYSAAGYEGTVGYVATFGQNVPELAIDRSALITRSDDRMARGRHEKQLTP